MARMPGDRFEDLLAAVPLGSAAKSRLRTLMSGSDRFYHGVAHLAVLWDRHLRFATQAGFDGPIERRRVACAIAFHDCIYEASRKDNEERSAELWLCASQEDGVPDDDREWVAGTIRATGDHLGCGARYAALPAPTRDDALRQWMLDLDLTPFGEEPTIFDGNTALLRLEAPHMTDEAFDTAMLRYMRRFASTSAIYRTPSIAATFDEKARLNIARFLDRAEQTRNNGSDCGQAP